MIALLPLLPLATGLAVWLTDLRPADRRPSSRVLGGVAVTGLIATLVVAVVVIRTSGTLVHDLGAGLALTLRLDPTASVMAVLVPAVAIPVVVYAVVHEEGPGLARLLGLLTAFVGAMLVIVVAADLLLLVVGWELVALVSWALIGHEWRDDSRPARAAHAFHATRVGAIGLVVAAAALYADTGSLAFASIAGAGSTTVQVVAAGVVLAAVSKSGQLPFAPWLFSAMAGPTPVSALLHSATMVAAGAFTLARLHPLLDTVSWFGPTLVVVGLATALAGGIVAAVQDHAKQLLAASTSAQYGLMVVAVGAGHPEVAMLHLVVHAVFKAQLFLSAGLAIEAVGSPSLGRMRLGRHLPVAAGISLVGALALGAVPPLGGGWTKEAVLAAGVEASVAVGVLVAVAGGLSAFYAARFQILAWGRHPTAEPGPRQLVRTPRTVEHGATGALAATSVGLGLLWLPSVHEPAAAALGSQLPLGHTWELVLSLSLLVIGVYAAVTWDRAGGLASVTSTPAGRALAPWLHLGELSRVAVADPTLALSRRLATFDDRVVDRGVALATAAARAASRGLAGAGELRVDGVVRAIAASGTRLSRLGADLGERTVDGAVERVAASGVRLARLGAGLGERAVDGAVEGVAWFIGRAGDDTRRMQTGFVHHQFVVIAVGVVVALVAATLGR